MNILQVLRDRSVERVERAKEDESCQAIIDEAQKRADERFLSGDTFSFEKALKQPGFHVIAELKKASPSKGLISPDFPYLQILKEYETAGASCISCLTEPEYFLGSLEILRDVTEHTTLPVLRKDFLVDTHQVYEAAANGADAVLLIAAILPDQKLKELFDCAESLGLSCLFEAHNEEEIERVLQCGARIVGVNNRDLTTFQADLSVTERLRKFVPEELIFVSESGMLSPSDIERMKRAGADAVLIGEGLMKSRERRELIGR